MKSRIRQLVSMVCSLALCAALVPAAVFAEAPEDAPAVTPAVAQIGDTTYPGLQRAVNAAQAGATITQKRFIAVKNDDYGVLNITGGTITSDDQAVQNWHAAAITGGTMNGPVISWAYAMPNMDSTLAISGSAVINGDVKSVTYDGKAVPRVTITGGTVNGTLIKGRFSSNAIQALPADSAAAALTVSGGTFKNAVPEAFCAENFHPNKNADGTYSVHTHQFGPWVTTVEPGPSTQGKQVQTCSVCGYEMAKTLPPTGNSGQPQKDPAKPDPAPVKPTPAPAPCFGAGRLRRPARPAYNRNHKGTRRGQPWASSFWTWTECCARPGALPSAACSAVPWTASSLTRGRCSGCGGW